MGMRYVANASNHRRILNNPKMVSLVGRAAKKVAAGYRTTTKKRTGLNASRVRTYTRTNSSRYRDRAGGIVETWGSYNLQRELGGERNAVPEMTLMTALALSGGDVSLYVAPGRYVPGGKVKSFSTLR